MCPVKAITIKVVEEVVLVVAVALVGEEAEDEAEDDVVEEQAAGRGVFLTTLSRLGALGTDLLVETVGLARVFLSMQ